MRGQRENTIRKLLDTFTQSLDVVCVKKTMVVGNVAAVAWSTLYLTNTCLQHTTQPL